MLQVRVHGPDDVRVDEVAAPDPGPRDAVVRVAACGICGSDLSYIRMGGLAGPAGTPMCLGHEVAGTVDWVGPEVTTAAVGDRVVVQPGNDELGRIGNGSPEGGLTPLLLVTEADRGRLHRIPDGLPLDVAALAEPLAVGMRAADQAEVHAGDGVAVFGCGPIGLSAIAALVDRGHRKVVAIDLSPTRLDLALGIGAQAALEPGDHPDLGRAGPAARHDTVRLRTDTGHCRLHRGIRLGPGHHRRHRSRPGRREAVGGRPPLRSRSPRTT